MTREELKKHCKKTVEQCEMWAIHRGEEPSGKVYEEHKAILDILKQAPCDDAISINAVDRFGVLNEIYEWTISGEYEQPRSTDILIKRINNMPSVQPSREAYKDCDNCKKCDESFMKGHNIGLENGYKQGVNDASVSRKGHWIDANGNTVKMIDGVPQDSCWCSECKEWLVASDEYSCKGYYCPNCGVEMENIE